MCNEKEAVWKLFIRIFLCKFETSKIVIGKTCRARIICTPECFLLHMCMDEDSSWGGIELKRGLETLLLRTQLCIIEDISHMM